MRAPQYLHRVSIPNGLHFKRIRDRGELSRKKVQRLKRAGYDGAVYLNRYEGITTEMIDRLAGLGDLSKLDSCSDAVFRKLVPEADDSYAIFDPEYCRVVSVEERPTPDRSLEIDPPQQALQSGS